MVDERVTHLVDDGGGGLTLESWLSAWCVLMGGQRGRRRMKQRRLTEGGLDDGDLGGCCVETGESAPVVDDESGANDL